MLIKINFFLLLLIFLISRKNRSWNEIIGSSASCMDKIRVKIALETDQFETSRKYQHVKLHSNKYSKCIINDQIGSIGDSASNFIHCVTTLIMTSVIIQRNLFVRAISNFGNLKELKFETVKYVMSLKLAKTTKHSTRACVWIVSS